MHVSGKKKECKNSLQIEGKKVKKQEEKREIIVKNIPQIFF